METNHEELERAKYEKAWKHDDYRNVAPGEGMIIPMFYSAKPKKGASIHDYGTGTGRSALFLRLSGFDVRMFDIAHNCLDEHVAMALRDRLTVANLWDLPAGIEVADHGYCTDVMEHIPTEHVDGVLENIARTCRNCFFQISFHEDHFGKEMDDVLHLTVKPFRWWRDKLRKHGNLIEARDLIWSGVFYMEFDHG